MSDKLVLTYQDFELTRVDAPRDCFPKGNLFSAGPLMPDTPVHIFHQDFFVVRKPDGQWFYTSEAQKNGRLAETFDEAVWRLYMDDYILSSLDPKDISEPVVQSIYHKYVDREGFPDLGAEELLDDITSGKIELSEADRQHHKMILLLIIELYETVKQSAEDEEEDECDIIDSITETDMHESLVTVWAALNDYREKVLTAGDPVSDEKWKKIRSAMIDVAESVDDEPTYGMGFR
ncbi:hypothetical protein [Sulfitobacter sp. R18_1]|uniref:hypothetical protein n=1 Tax=Sulfitobacter sp. R18_1 TaxID=2821104 RepID=UPI001ADCE518|nr:hypothetical protein [Sulfitobacter sp. R18_1]MBO9428722.1 hypothetical protein [Sulfitobacter sp. R18_1]